MFIFPVSMLQDFPPVLCVDDLIIFIYIVKWSDYLCLSGLQESQYQPLQHIVKSVGALKEKTVLLSVQ